MPKLQSDEQANGGKDGGGKTHREMRLMAHGDVQQVAGHAAYDQEQPGETIAHRFAEQVDHQAADKAVAGQVDQIGVQLDALGLQLETVDPNHPAAVQTRQLVGEHLPEMIDAYRRIPAQLRREQRAGATPDQQITDSLGKISREIDTVTRQLADGALDDLAIRTRYLDYRYGADGEPASLPMPVPTPDSAPEKP